ncbi:hypothetical protein AURDEDRAFT_146327 [Auricularia subglabra TFB-10046 SS5]|nr:hypothetical protein AURDEDRAFT_146327 [Auricularia subglabra TFB-10046 SS5]
MFALRALRVGLGPAVYGALRATQAPAAIGRLTALRSFTSSAPALLATAAKKTTVTTKKKTSATTKKPATKKKTTAAAAKKKPATKARAAARKPAKRVAKKKTDGRAAAAKRRERARRAARTPEQRAEERKAAREKKKRDLLRAIPKPPKRVPTPFALFVKQHPVNGHGPEFIRQLSAQWAVLPLADKAQYTSQTEALRPLYKAEFDRWAKSLSPLDFTRLNADLRRRGKSRIRPPPKAPEDKQPLGPFLRYFSDFRRNAGSGLTIAETGKAAGASWRAMSDAEKRPYTDAYARDRAAYQARKSA